LECAGPAALCDIEPQSFTKLSPQRRFGVLFISHQIFDNVKTMTLIATSGERKSS